MTTLTAGREREPHNQYLVWCPEHADPLEGGYYHQVNHWPDGHIQVGMYPDSPSCRLALQRLEGAWEFSLAASQV